VFAKSTRIVVVVSDGMVWVSTPKAEKRRQLGQTPTGCQGECNGLGWWCLTLHNGQAVEKETSPD